MKMLKIYTDFIRDMEELDDAEKGRLFVMMLSYASSGNAPAPQGNERFVWGTARKMIDAQRQSYERICDRNRVNGEKHLSQTNPNEPKATQSNPNEPKASQITQVVQEQEQEQEQEKEQEHRFIAPTVAEVKTYCKERRNNVDAERFVNFYMAKGWKVGKNPMKDWKAAVRTWEKSNTKPNRVINGYAQSDLGDIEHMIVDL